MRGHTQEKKIHCDQCDLKFVDLSTLRKHLRTHTGEKPYECSQCAKRFSQSGNLKRHMLVHDKYATDQNFPSSFHHNYSSPSTTYFVQTIQPKSFQFGQSTATVYQESCGVQPTYQSNNYCMTPTLGSYSTSTYPHYWIFILFNNFYSE